jgi:uncharacterized protein YmfQ (DUF2313 family)
MSDRAAIRAALAALAPTGPALPREPGSAFDGLLSALSGELAIVLGRARAARDEADPRAADELLADWERVAGLPDPCLGPAPTVAQRRARLVQQLTAARGQSPAFFVGLAAALGRAATVTEFREHDCEQTCEAPAHDTAWRFAWRFTLLGGSAETAWFHPDWFDPEWFDGGGGSAEAAWFDPDWFDPAWFEATGGGTAVIEATCEDGCETPLARGGDSVVECVVGALKPAHTILIFAYA